MDIVAVRLVWRFASQLQAFLDGVLVYTSFFYDGSRLWNRTLEWRSHPLIGTCSITRASRKLLGGPFGDTAGCSEAIVQAHA